jgi:uncharacterized protein (DUF2336 family)
VAGGFGQGLVYWAFAARAQKSALARAYLYSDLSPDDLAAVEGVMLMLLDDRSPLVRQALAEALAASPIAPPAIIVALAADQPQIAALVYAASPLFVDADLVDAVVTADAGIQAAIAGRAALPRVVAAAIAETAAEEPCLILVENHTADIAPHSIDRIVERFGHLAPVREALLTRDDIPSPTRQTLVTKLSETLAGFIVERDESRSRPANSPRSLREGDGVDRGRNPAERAAPTDPSSLRQRSAYGRADLAGAIVRKYRLIRRGARRADRHAGDTYFRHRARPRRRKLARFVRQSAAAAIDVSGFQGGDPGDA